MRIFKEAYPFLGGIPLAVATGTFDGVHTGHCKIFEQLFKTGQEHGLNTAILTFSPHPRSVLFDSPVSLLTTDDEKAELIASLPFAPDFLIFFPFSIAISSLSARRFLGDILVGRLGMKTLVAGYDHHIGNGRDAGPDDLKRLGMELGFQLVEVPACSSGQNIISSSGIRKALGEGDITEVNRLLGYPYRISGTVGKGNSIGKKLGFPTANIVTEDHKILPAHGVYAAVIFVRSRRYKGMLNTGLRPTLHSDGGIITEVHIFEFDENIYDQKISIQLHFRIRDEQRFLSLDDLRLQLEQDRQSCLKLLEFF